MNVIFSALLLSAPFSYGFSLFSCNLYYLRSSFTRRLSGAPRLLYSLCSCASLLLQRACFKPHILFSCSVPLSFTTLSWPRSFQRLFPAHCLSSLPSLYSLWACLRYFCLDPVNSVFFFFLCFSGLYSGASLPFSLNMFFPAPGPGHLPSLSQCQVSHSLPFRTKSSDCLAESPDFYLPFPFVLHVFPYPGDLGAVLFRKLPKYVEISNLHGHCLANLRLRMLEIKLLRKIFGPEGGFRLSCLADFIKMIKARR
jgi:hypothetical protein